MTVFHVRRAFLHIMSVPSPRGGFGGLIPQTKLQTPKLKRETL